MTRPVPDSAWLLAHRATVADGPEDYCDRPAVTVRCDPVRRPFTVLTAPGGFGKTTVLAAACRTALAAGTPVAWLTLADDDDATLDAYLAFAFERAGPDVRAAIAEHGPPPDAGTPRTDLLIRAVEACGRTFVLALDELENVADRDAVRVLDRLLAHAPACLHLAMAYRALPAGLGAARRVLDGADVIGADDLRFEKHDIARFFDLALSRDRLAAGLDDEVVAALSGHSARVGATQDMIAAGIELPAILHAGRWKTATMVTRYGERLLAQRSGSAQLARRQGRE